MMITKAESGKRKAERRQASTLSEVLVAIMILSIGIISLATLFPISILRSLQATQLTNGTILRYNAETAIEITTALVYDPDHNTNTLEHDGTNFLVDPLGFARSNGGGSVGVLTRYPGLARFDPGSVAQSDAIANALDAVTLPDSWVLFYEGVPSSNTLTSFEVDSNDIGDGVIDVAQLGNILTSGVEVRAILFSSDERSSQQRLVTSAAGTTVSWTTTPPTPLPTSYNGAVPRVRIETREHRYSWLLSVRRAPTSQAGVATVDVVIFFRRPDPPAGETSYDASFVAGSQEATVRFTGEGPDLKKGGYVLDASNARWYRIQKITETSGGAKLQLGRPAVETGTKAVVMEGVVDVYPIGNKLP